MKKYIKPLDYVLSGIYIVGENYELSIMFTFMMLHFFPLVYLLRKHGYFKISDEFGYNISEKGIDEIKKLAIQPIKEFFKSRKRIVSLISFLLKILKYLFVLCLGAILYQIGTLYIPF